MPLDEKKRGVKRKREEVEVDLQQKLSGKLHHGLREAKHAAKKIKGFEVQRLIKKLKATRSSVDVVEVAQLESQLKELKEADPERIGTLAFFNRVKKDKVLSRHPDFQAAFEDQRSRVSVPMNSGLSPQLESRLLSSKALATEINELITSLRAVIAPAVLPAEGRETDEEAGEGFTESVERPTKVAKLDSPSMSGTAKFQQSITSNAGGDSSEGGESDDEVLGAEPGQPIADDSGWESGTVDEESNHAAASDSDSDSESNSLASAALPSSTAATDNSKPHESMFLPSLAVGFTRGDSDSDFSDSEAKVADSVRKNRRGQRARRAIWEKKYGKGAKHLNKLDDDDRQQARGGVRPHVHERGGLREQDSGRASQPGRFSRTNTGGPPSRDVVPRDQPQSRPYHSVPRYNGPPPPLRGLQKSAEEKPLHPSWEAKKRMKEQQSAIIRPPTGTRITFND